MNRFAPNLSRLRRLVPALEMEIANQVIAVESARFHVENFNQEAFNGATTQKWKPRKKPVAGRKILIESGRTRRKASRGRVQGKQVIFTLPGYSRYHNEGRSPMPKRQFVGYSPVLKRRFRKKAEIIINRRLNRLQ